MTTPDLPDREGWVGCALAQLPACPPFPAFTDFERQALDAMAPLFGDDADAFRAQVAAATVIDRVNTVVGFYTRVAVDRAACAPLAITHKGAAFEVEGVAYGMGVVLWDQDGFLETIEGYTYGEEDLNGQGLASLKILRVVQLG